MRYVDVVTGEIFDMPRYRNYPVRIEPRNTPVRKPNKLGVKLFTQFGAILFWLSLASALLLNVSHNH